MWYKYNKYILRRIMCIFGIHHMQQCVQTGTNEFRARVGVWCVVCGRTTFAPYKDSEPIGMGTYIMEYKFPKNAGKL